MRTQVTFYRGVMRCQFSTQRSKELGKEHRSIFRHIALEPTFELFAAEEISQEAYREAVVKLKQGPFLHHAEREVVDYYHQALAPHGKRMVAEEIWMGLDTEPKMVEDKVWEWNSLRFDEIPPKFLHDCFLAFHPNANHGRIGGPVYLKRVQQLDDKNQEVVAASDWAKKPSAALERQGIFQEARGCTRKIYGINAGIKHWVNSIFGGVFGSELIGQEPNGCLPSILPSGCSGAGCQRFGCGILSLLLSFAFLLWLLRFLLFGDTSNSDAQTVRVVEKIVHDTIYIEKNSRVDTVTYVDETTNTTVKMISLPNVQFEKNKDKLLASSIPQLNELAAYLMENKQIDAEIIGHTDSDGDAEANRILSQKRAEAVRQYLIENGVEAIRVKATGKGESEPVTENNTAEGRAMNRRVEVKLSEANTHSTTRTTTKRRQS
ncbi:MAG: hypothetical protein RL432_1399 [Bacteroidota bacterium]